jgi:hypothetical protein
LEVDALRFSLETRQHESAVAHQCSCSSVHQCRTTINYSRFLSSRTFSISMYFGCSILGRSRSIEFRCASWQASQNGISTRVSAGRSASSRFCSSIHPRSHAMCFVMPGTIWTHSNEQASERSDTAVSVGARGRDLELHTARGGQTWCTLRVSACASDLCAGQYLVDVVVLVYVLVLRHPGCRVKVAAASRIQFDDLSWPACDGGASASRRVRSVLSTAVRCARQCAVASSAAWCAQSLLLQLAGGERIGC